MSVPLVKVRCVSCKATKEVRADEIPANDVPYCDKCHMPMATIAVKVKL